MRSTGSNTLRHLWRVTRTALLSICLLACGTEGGGTGTANEFDGAEPGSPAAPADVAEPGPPDVAPEPDVPQGRDKDTDDGPPSACGETGDDCTFSVTGHLLGGGFVMATGDTHTLEQQLSAPTIVGTTTDGTYTITPGLPGREAP